MISYYRFMYYLLMYLFFIAITYSAWWSFKIPVAIRIRKAQGMAEINGDC
jgi:hypothetical protein